MSVTSDPIKICHPVNGECDHIYAFRKYRVCQSGSLWMTGSKEDVTEQINKIISDRVWRFAGKCPSLCDALLKGLLIEKEK